MKEMCNLYISYILFSVFLRKTMKKFSSLPLKPLTCENVLNHLSRIVITLEPKGFKRIPTLFFFLEVYQYPV